MDDEGFISQVDNPGHSVAGLKGSHRPGDEFQTPKVFHLAMVVTVLNVLEIKIQTLSTCTLLLDPISLHSGLFFAKSLLANFLYDTARRVIQKVISLATCVCDGG